MLIYQRVMLVKQKQLMSIPDDAWNPIKIDGVKVGNGTNY
jgi:hypothetical protein